MMKIGRLFNDLPSIKDYRVTNGHRNSKEF